MIIPSFLDMMFNEGIYRLSWYVGEKYLRDLRAREDFSTRVLESVEALACFLVSEVRSIERGTEITKREAKEQVPSDRVKDPSAVARELRWRTRLALGFESDGEPSDRRKMAIADYGCGAQKRKRTSTDDFVEREPKILNMQSVVWDASVKSEVASSRQLMWTRPTINSDGWEQEWLAKEVV